MKQIAKLGHQITKFKEWIKQNQEENAELLELVNDLEFEKNKLEKGEEVLKEAVVKKEVKPKTIKKSKEI